MKKPGIVEEPLIRRPPGVNGESSKLVFLDSADKNRLNDFVASADHAHFKQLYDWGEVLSYERTRAVYLGVERNRELCASLAVYVRRIPKLNLSFLNGSRGPILNFANRSALAHLVEGAREVARQHEAIFLRVDPECADEDHATREALCDAGFVHLRQKKWSDLNDPRIVMCLDLTLPELELLKGIRQTHRRHIRWISRKRIIVRDARDKGEVAQFRAIMAQVGEQRGFPVRSLAYYERLWDRFVKPGRGRLILAENGGDPVAGLLAIAVGKKAWLLYTGLVASARSLHPNEAVWWEALRWARRKGAMNFNFGGSGTDWPPQENSPGYSVYLFKRGFNAGAVYLTGYYDFVFKPKLYRIFRLAEERLLPRIASSGLLRKLIHV